MKEKKGGLLAYGVLLLCLSFTLGYLLGHGSGETEIQVVSAPSAVAESEEKISVPTEESAVVPAKTAPVNINTADSSVLEQLPGIGPALASRIIDYRKQHGHFTSKEQIMDVKGIGEKKYADLESLITIGGGQ